MCNNKNMVSSISNSFNFNETVSQLYTVNSTAKLAKVVINAKIKDATEENKEKIVSDVIDYNDENSEKSIDDILRDYTKNISSYLKNMNSSEDKTLTRADYSDIGMGGYYDAQIILQKSRAINAYSLENKSYTNPTKTNSFTIGV